jgi:endo-1,4-beta-xylanase
MKFKITFVLAIIMCFTVFTVTAQTVSSNSTGTANDGYWYTFWKDNQGSVTMTMGSNGQFSVNWSNTGNFVCGKGWQTGSENRTITWTSNNGNAQYVGVYGWTTNPLVEYYIPRSGGTNRGTYQADGTTYTLYTNTRVNKPSIVGDTTFEQYFCGGGSGGSVNFGEHCNGWRSLGMGVGNQNYQVLAIEGWGGSSGSASATLGGTTTTPDPTPVPTDPGTPTPTRVPGTISIACGSSSGVGYFEADQYYSGGETYNNTNTINVSQITTDTPPPELFNNERYGAMTYTIPGFTSGNSYDVTLYFAETYLTSSGSRVFNVSINGTSALSNFDIYSAAGGQDRAIAREFSAAANSSGQIVIQFTAVTENPKINGISIKPGSGPTATPITTAPPTTPTPTPVVGDCNVSFNPENSTQILNSTFQIDVVVDSGSQKLAAYGITVSYNANILSVVDVEKGAEGFLAAANTENPGEIVASGFDSSGTGPGSNLQVLIITFNAEAEGTSTLGLYVDELVDGGTNTIGTACGIDGSVTVSDTGLLGDTNGDGEIGIVDALLIAQYYVDLNPDDFILSNADTNCDGEIGIVDALLVAQYYVGLINGFCL